MNDKTKLSDTWSARHTRLRDVYHIKAGTMSQVFMPLDRDQYEWLGAEAERMGCETLAEYLVELVRDAHAESVDRKRKAA